MSRCPGARAVKVYYMHPRRAGVGVMTRLFDRVHLVRRLPVVVAVQKPHDLAVTQVDGGEQVRFVSVVYHA